MTTRPTAEQLAEIRAKVAEWDRLVTERPQQFVHTKTTLSVGYLLTELDAVRGERDDVARQRDEHIADKHRILREYEERVQELRREPNITDAMVERAARVLVDEGDSTVGFWEDQSDKSQADFLSLARAALNAALQ